MNLQSRSLALFASLPSVKGICLVLADNATISTQSVLPGGQYE